MQFELFIAARYLRAKRRQAVIGVITVISIIGVAAGVASLIIALAINNGFRQDLQDRLLGSTSHINLLRIQSDGIRNWESLLARMQKQPHVRPKPAPDILRLCLDRAAVEAPRAVYVGDSRIDYEAADSAGMHFIGAGSRIEHTRMIATIADLEAALERLDARRD